MKTAYKKLDLINKIITSIDSISIDDWQKLEVFLNEEIKALENIKNRKSPLPEEVDKRLKEGLENAVKKYSRRIEQIEYATKYVNDFCKSKGFPLVAPMTFERRLKKLLGKENRMVNPNILWRLDFVSLINKITSNSLTFDQAPKVKELLFKYKQEVEKRQEQTKNATENIKELWKSPKRKELTKTVEKNLEVGINSRKKKLEELIQKENRICPFCESQNVRKNGRRKDSGQQKYICRQCGKSW